MHSKISEINSSWQRCLLSDLFDIRAGGDIDKENCSDKQSTDYPYPVYANALKNDGLYGYANYYKCDGDTITVTGRGEIGYAIARHHKFVPIVRLLVLIPKVDLNVDYFTAVINNSTIFVESTGVPQLTSPQLGKLIVPLPPLNEQNAFAEFIINIDNKITNCLAILDNLIAQKNGILQSMFI